MTDWLVSLKVENNSVVVDIVAALKMQIWKGNRVQLKKQNRRSVQEEPDSEDLGRWVSRTERFCGVVNGDYIGDDKQYNGRTLTAK